MMIPTKSRRLNHRISKYLYHYPEFSSEATLRTEKICPKVDKSRFWLPIVTFLLVATLAWNIYLVMMYGDRVQPLAGRVKSVDVKFSVGMNMKSKKPSSVQWLPLPEPNQVLTRIAFGSCSSQHMAFTYWDTLAEYQPDLVLLMGDNVYGDCDEPTCETLRLSYAKMAGHPSVQGAAQQFPVYATLDDHDYGKDGAGASNPYKEVARELFANFFQVPEMPIDGVYRAASFGPEGQRLQIILLDTRYSRSPLLETGDKQAPFRPQVDNATTPQVMLGPQQWIWLRKQLEEPADLRLIVSSIQVLSDTTAFESWRLLPKERKRFYELIQGKSVVLLSGDRHMGAFYESQDGSIPEITASSWTHTHTTGTFGNCTTDSCVKCKHYLTSGIKRFKKACNGDKECKKSCNIYVGGKGVGKGEFGGKSCNVSTQAACEEAGHCQYNTEICDEIDPRRISEFVRVNNFGSIEIDWENRNITVGIRNADTTYAIWEELYYRRKYKRGKASDAGEVLLSRELSF